MKEAAMANEPPVPDVRALWQCQPAEGVPMSVAEVDRKSRELQGKARRRLKGIYVAAAGNAGIPLILMWFLPELRLALGYLVVTAVFLVSFVRRRSILQTISPTMTAAQGLVFYRQALERERDFRRDSSWWFTIGPALNILILGLVYVKSPLFHGTIAELFVLATILATHIVVLAVVARRLRSEVRAYQREIDQSWQSAARSGPS
jgi:cobalamin biosynthesis protein CobD/CbiB